MNSATAFTIAIPTLAVMFGILLNRQDATALRAEMNQLRANLQTEMGQLRADLHADMARLRDSIHSDMVGIHERIAVV